MQQGTTDIDLADLGERVEQFQSLSLPGQPQMMHMGTSQLVHDLWTAVKTLIAAQGQGDG